MDSDPTDPDPQHCLRDSYLCLFVIGLTFDCYDGKRGAVEGQAVLSADQQKAALPSRPGLLDMLAHSFFVGGYFVGPQFTMRKFLTVCQPDFQANAPNSVVDPDP
jgi:lysophospholipid acyltransferase 5